METASALYECSVMHHRLAPRVHHFEYRVFYLWLDLGEIDGLARNLRCFSRNRFNLFSFYDRDHLNLGADTARENLLRWLEGQGMDTRPVARVMLLAFPRVLGHVFNPVCFFYCFDAQGAPLCAVAQVTNTFREQKPYLLRERDADGRFRLLAPKHFYVSPFSALDVCFDFKLRQPGENLEIRIDDFEGAERILCTTLTGRRRPLSSARLLASAVKYPLLTLRVIFLIHWHALRLGLKRIPWHRKAARADLQQGVLNPHDSITPSKP